MLKYMSYLFANVRKKWSTYLIPLFGALVLIAVLLASILTNKTDKAVVGNLSTFYYFLPFVFGAMFVGTKALNVFKDGEADGTELLIVSKPISRGQIVLGKFATLYLLIIGYAIWSFVTTMAVGFVDDNATTSAIMNFAGGYAIGSMIIMVIFSAIITFFASMLGKIGTMSLSIIVPAILPILSFILVPVGHGSLQDLGGQMSQHRMYSTTIDGNGNTVIQDPSYMYEDDDSDYKAALKQKQDGFYKYVTYGDVWQHMFGFYSVLTPQALDTSSQGVKVEKGQQTLTNKDGFIITDYETNIKYLYILNANDEDASLVSSKMTQFFKLLIDNNIKLAGGDWQDPVNPGVSGKGFYDLEQSLKDQVTAFDENKTKESMKTTGEPINYADSLQGKIDSLLGEDDNNSWELAIVYFANQIPDFKISGLYSSSNNKLHQLSFVISDGTDKFIYNNPLTKEDAQSFISSFDRDAADQINVGSSVSAEDALKAVINQIDLSGNSYKTLVDKYTTPVLYDFATAYFMNAKNVSISDLGTNLGMNFTKFDGNYEIVVDNLTIKKYLDNGTIIAIYSALAVLLSGLVIFRYYRRDFK